ncbi:MAG: ABC transporter substrate-binding protein [Rhodobacteraceae bacterium GWE1_64_9]|nr:MAG: ABC transporter substrate-binding protein [Rhodobacteraceae bacterium GWE1_64_9]OHC48989.1 MAG: ABC transporter substrate-binding protein [Rhodobacteraceae bacterium GWF1_65_7]HBD91231.1 ABC transporter substrate-binding protein [Gemmobacter sp.]HBU15968.1 ABC transporter substrate-binding protein [Gemmobacter sp.]
MLTFTIRRLLTAIPTLLLISLVIFLLVDFAPGSPMSDIPLTVPPEIRRKMIEAMGADQPVMVRYVLWLKQFFIVEPQYMFDAMFGTNFADGAQRIISWQSKVPVFQIIGQRLPQTLTVVGTAYAIGVLIALPIGIYSAYRQYSWFDQAGTFFAMAGFSVPTFFTGNLLILIFSVKLGWFPTIFDTNLQVTDWASFYKMVMQMALPVTVLALFNAAEISRYTRSSMLENLGQDYVRTARAKGLTERVVVLKHVLRNSLIPVVTVIALGLPTVFGGAIVTEQIFKINGIGAALIGAIHVSDLPTVQTITFIFAVLIVGFNLIADILYGMLDPRIRYD